MKKIVRRFLVGSILLFFVLGLYTIWDNNRLTVEEQEIAIDNLPKDLENFIILQITDLHEKTFGKNQKRLVNLINTIDYDAIVFTGDMLDSTESKNYTPFYNLIEGINNKENALYVPGNADPVSNNRHGQDIPYDEFEIGMEERGVNRLESVDSVKVDGSTVYFVDFNIALLDPKENISLIGKKLDTEDSSYKKFLQHKKYLLEEMRVLDNMDEKDVIISLSHYPIVDRRIDNYMNHPDPKITFRDIDLIIAGHYHGGQIRLPFLGALFIPEPYYKNRGLFPPQDRVKGLWEYKGIKQYVSTGLGSSDAISFLKFRFLNPPEINVLILKIKN